MGNNNKRLDLYWLAGRVWNIIAKPSGEWLKIRQEGFGVYTITRYYVLPFLAILTLADLGRMLAAGENKAYILLSVMLDLSTPVAIFFASAVTIRRLALQYRYFADRDFFYSLVAYSYTPFFLAGILIALHTGFILLAIFGFYSIYIYKKGLDVLVNLPQNKKAPFFMISYLIIFLFTVVVDYLTTSLAESVRLAP